MTVAVKVSAYAWCKYSTSKSRWGLISLMTWKFVVVLFLLGNRSYLLCEHLHVSTTLLQITLEKIMKIQSVEKFCCMV